MSERLCGWCGRPVPDGQGCLHIESNLVSHHPECSDFVVAVRRDYSRSQRGRMRTPARLKRLLAHRRSLLAAKGPRLPFLSVEA